MIQASKKKELIELLKILNDKKRSIKNIQNLNDKLKLTRDIVVLTNIINYDDIITLIGEKNEAN